VLRNMFLFLKIPLFLFAQWKLQSPPHCDRYLKGVRMSNFLPPGYLPLPVVIRVSTVRILPGLPTLPNAAAHSGHVRSLGYGKPSYTFPFSAARRRATACHDIEKQTPFFSAYTSMRDRGPPLFFIRVFLFLVNHETPWQGSIPLLCIGAWES